MHHGVYVEQTDPAAQTKPTETSDALETAQTAVRVGAGSAWLADGFWLSLRIRLGVYCNQPGPGPTLGLLQGLFAIVQHF